MLRNYASETEFLGNWHEANLKRRTSCVIPSRPAIQKSQSVNHEQARDAVGQAVRESSENYNGTTMQKIFKVLRVM